MLSWRCSCNGFKAELCWKVCTFMNFKPLEAGVSKALASTRCPESVPVSRPTCWVVGVVGDSLCRGRNQGSQKEEFVRQFEKIENTIISGKFPAKIYMKMLAQYLNTEHGQRFSNIKLRSVQKVILLNFHQNSSFLKKTNFLFFGEKSKKFKKYFHKLLLIKSNICSKTTSLKLSFSFDIQNCNKLLWHCGALFERRVIVPFLWLGA